jgi:hypothetical protein
MRKVVLGTAAAALMIGGVHAGGIDWTTPATDLSDSLQGGADAAIPFVVSGGMMAAAFHVGNVVGPMLGIGVGMYAAANSDQAQTVLGGGGAGGGLITDTVYFVGS